MRNQPHLRLPAPLLPGSRPPRRTAAGEDLHFQVAANLPQALEYQPLLNRNGHLDALEALLRRNSPVLGRVSPADFIPIAEEMELILSIGEWVTETACRQGAEWLRAGYEVPRMAVNVSAVQLIEKGFAPTVERVLKQNPFPAAKLELKITETALMDNLDRASEPDRGTAEPGSSFLYRRFRHWLLIPQSPLGLFRWIA